MNPVSIARLTVRLSLLVAMVMVMACKPGVLNEPSPIELGYDPTTGKLVPCDAAHFKGITLDEVTADFTKNVEPSLIAPGTGCTSCHGSASGRSFMLSGDAKSDFNKAYAAGLLSGTPGSILDRLQSTDVLAKMPRDESAWTVQKIAPVNKVACELSGVQLAGGPGPDEMFPPDLTTPYSGPAIAYYDNTFLNYSQLKGKVKTVFNDDWVRGTVDNFTTNIGPLGGVDFSTHFIEARTATSDFLLSLDPLSKDVCSQAATKKTGPFTGLDTLAAVVDQPTSQTQKFEAESITVTPATGAGQMTTNPVAAYQLNANGTLSTSVNFPSAGSYTLTLRALGSFAHDPDGTLHFAIASIKIDSVEVKQIETTAAYADYGFTITVASGGAHDVSISFINDYTTLATTPKEDRNFSLDYFTVAGSAGTARSTAAKNNIKTLYSKMLYRAASDQEVTDTYSLLTDLTVFNALPDPWSGVCEALIRHPDFLFTLPPSRAKSTNAPERQQLLQMKIALDLIARAPTPAELTQLASASSDTMVDYYLRTPEFQTYFFYKMRIRTESDGTSDADEPARLWTYLMLNGQPFQQLLNGDYSVDPSFKKIARDAIHGATGVLTMKGFIQHKQGLPHYNYAARVLEDFMGYVFEVPPEVAEMRLGATAATTVDPKSICFNCHQLLTPLATQRQAWDDDGNYRTVDGQGQPIDDTDKGLVPTYPYKGKGMQSFSTLAVKKERFIRHTLDAEYTLLFGRPMRYDQDERGIYKQLWDMNGQTQGNLRSTLKAMIATQSYQGL